MTQHLAYIMYTNEPGDHEQNQFEDDRNVIIA